jgi:hypothetical protein
VLRAGLGSSPRHSGDVRRASRGGASTICPHGAHAVGVGAAVAGRETGLMGGAHESARGRASERVGRCRQGSPTG